MKRPGYREAVEWLAGNDDCHWLADEIDPIPSVSACMIRDLFNIEEKKLFNDVRRAVAKIYPDHPAVKERTR